MLLLFKPSHRARGGAVPREHLLDSQRNENAFPQFLNSRWFARTTTVFRSFEPDWTAALVWMSFWKFGFAPAPSSIESLLNSFFAPPSSSSVAVAADLSARTLDLLLACPDLLSEVKSGSNARSMDFLARAEVVQRLGGWIVWGLGGDMMENVLNGGILPDDVEDGPVPEINVAASDGKSSGMGGVPRRMNLNALGEFEGDDVEQSLELASAPYVEIDPLSVSSTQITTAAFLDWQQRFLHPTHRVWPTFSSTLQPRPPVLRLVHRQYHSWSHSGQSS